MRNDIGHATLFFGGMIVLVAVLPWGRDRRMQAGLAIALAVSRSSRSPGSTRRPS